MRTVPVSKCLDKQLKIAGFEVFDLLAIFLVLSALNLFFGQTGYSLFLVWLPSSLLAILLRYGKRDKPEKYLVHLLRYWVRPGIYSAFLESQNQKSIKRNPD